MVVRRAAACPRRTSPEMPLTFMTVRKLIVGFFLFCQPGIAQWVEQTIPNNPGNVHFTDVHFLDKDFGFASGTYGAVYKTTDGGDHWVGLDTRIIESLMTVFAVSRETVYTSRDSLFRSIDGGNSWSYRGFGDYAGSIFKMTFRNPQVGYLLKEGNVFKTTDGGDTWFYLYSAGFSLKLQFTSDSVGYAWGGITYEPGSFADLHKTSDAGAIWQKLAISDSVTEIMALYFLDDTTGYFITYNCELYKTTNGGMSWSVVNARVSENYITACWFVSDTVGYVTDYNGQYIANILKTSDGGLHWSVDYSDSENAFAAIYFPDTSTGYVVGRRGTIFKHTSNGPTPVGDESSRRPVRFSLYQNFPNPFNPATTILYYLPQRARVSLNLYDMLGQEVSVLVDKEESVGEHEVLFDAGDKLPSGIYFCRLVANPILLGRAGTITETKKLVFIK